MNSYIPVDLKTDLLNLSIILKEKISNTTKIFDNELCIINRANEVIETINKFDICEKARTELDKFWYNFVKNNSRKAINRIDIVNKLKKISKSKRMKLLLGSIKDDNNFIEEIKIIDSMTYGLNGLSWVDIWNLTVDEIIGSKEELLKAVKIVISNNLFQELSFGSNVEKLLHELQLNKKNYYISEETIDFIKKLKNSINLILKYKNDCTDDVEKMCLILQQTILSENDMYYNIYVKNVDFALDSVIRNHHGNILDLTDLIWCDLIFNNIDDMDKIIKELLNSNSEYSFYVQEIIDNFDFSKSAISQNGYRYIRLELVNKKSGMNCELRLHLREMYELRENLNIKYGCDIDFLSQSFTNSGIFIFSRMLERIDVPVRYQLCEIYIKKILDHEKYSLNQFNFQLLRHLGSILCDLRLFDEAKNIISKTCNIIKKIDGDEYDLELARNLHILASSNANKELYIETLEQFNQAKELLEKSFDTNHIEVISTIRNKAVILLKQNKLDESIQEFLFVLRIFEKILGSNHVQVGIILNEISLIYCEKKKYKDALDLANNALNIFKEHFGTTHIYYLKVEYTIATIYERQENFTMALFTYNKCINDFITIIGAEHEHSSLLLSKKGKIQLKLELYDNALSSLETALQINQRIYGLNDPKTIETLLNLANGLYLASKIKEAIDIYNNVLIIQEKKLDSKNITIANNLLNIGIILLKDKNYVDSIIIFEKALNIYEANNKYSINYLNTLFNLILAYLHLNNDTKATIFINKSYDLNKKILNSATNPEEYKKILNVITKGLMKIAYIYKNNNNFDSALNILENALNLNLIEDEIKIENEELNICSDELPILYICIGCIYSQLNNNDCAIYNYKKALYIWLPLKKNNSDTLRTLHSITKLYEKQNNWKKAEESYNTILIFQNEMYGKQSKEVAGTLEKIGICNLNLTKFNEALSIFKKSLKIRDKLYTDAIQINKEITLESKSILLENIAKTYFLIGKVYSELSKIDEALESYKSSITAYETLSTVLVCQKRYQEAINLYQHELIIKNNLNKIEYESNLENINPNKKRRHNSKI